MSDRTMRLILLNKQTFMQYPEKCDDWGYGGKGDMIPAGEYELEALPDPLIPNHAAPFLGFRYEGKIYGAQGHSLITDGRDHIVVQIPDVLRMKILMSFPGDKIVVIREGDATDATYTASLAKAPEIEGVSHPELLGAIDKLIALLAEHGHPADRNNYIIMLNF